MFCDINKCNINILRANNTNDYEVFPNYVQNMFNKFSCYVTYS